MILIADIDDRHQVFGEHVNIVPVRFDDVTFIDALDLDVCVREVWSGSKVRFRSSHTRCERCVEHRENRDWESAPTTETVEATKTLLLLTKEPLMLLGGFIQKGRLEFLLAGKVCDLATKPSVEQFAILERFELHHGTLLCFSLEQVHWYSSR